MTTLASLPPPPTIQGVHHAAYLCFDAAETRAFYEDVCGLKTVAAFTFNDISGTDIKIRYMHIFFEMADGNCIAFFDLPTKLRPNDFKRASGFKQHIAMRVETEDEMLAFKKRWEAAGYHVDGPLDHHFVRSIYTHDPNGIQVEITIKTPEYGAIMAKEQTMVEETMAAWEKETRPLKDAYLKAQSPAKSG
ncbi:MAG: VOC family protein [Rhodospirillaceae bacterium]|nr:VOC family protein [Rhodospirillaceae bacterium]